MERRGEDSSSLESVDGMNGSGSRRSRLSLTERLMENIRKYAPELEISREATEIEMRIGHHTCAEYPRIEESSPSSDSVGESGFDGPVSNNEVAPDSVDEENRVTSTEPSDEQEVMRDQEIKSEMPQNEELERGTVPPSPLIIDSVEWDVVYVDDRVETEGVGHPDINPLSSTELTVRLIGSRKFYLRPRVVPDTVLASDSPKLEPTCQNLKENQEGHDSVLDKVADSRNDDKVVKSGQASTIGWWNLWGLFTRAPKVYPSSFLHDVKPAVPESMPEIRATEDAPAPTKPEVNQAGVSLVDDAGFPCQNIEANPEWSFDDNDAGQNAEVGESVVTALEGESQTERLQILESLTYPPGYSTPLEDSTEPPQSPLMPETSGHEDRGVAKPKNSTTNVSPPKKSRKKKKSDRSKVPNPVRDSSNTTEVISRDCRDPLELTPKIHGIVDSLGKEAEEGQVDILFRAKSQILIEGEESEEDPALFVDDEETFPTGVHVPPVLSDSIVGSFSEGSVWVRGQTLLRRDFPIRGPESGAEPPKSRWKTFFGKKNKKKDKVTKMAEQKSRDETGGSKGTSWFRDLRRTVRDRWNRITGRKRARVGVAPPTLIPEQATKIDEVPKANTSSPLCTKSKSAPILGRSSNSKSKSWVKR